jgi:hypothetical protein
VPTERAPRLQRVKAYQQSSLLSKELNQEPQGGASNPEYEYPIE